MRIEFFATTWSRLTRMTCAMRWTATALLCAVLAACASTPPPAPEPAPKVASRIERIEAALKAMSFEKQDDGWYLSLPAPLIFPFDSDVVATDARENLFRIALQLRELGIDRVMVRGHTDNVGTREYNLALSKRRADAIAAMLGEGGFPFDRIDAKGLGFSLPIADNATPEGRAKNRRVVIIVQII